MSVQKLLLPLSLTLATFLNSHLTAGIGSATSDSPVRTAQQQPNCKNPQTQAEMNACAGLFYQQADKKLNQVYPQLRGKLQATRRELLTNAQLAWIEFRDNNCEFERSAVEGGTMAPTIYGGCLTDMTEKRTAELESYIRDRILQPSSRNYQASDRKLNQIYKQLVSNLPSPRRNKLQKAELAWIAFRDANCKFEKSAAASNETLCLTRLTEQRTKDIEKSLDLAR